MNVDPTGLILSASVLSCVWPSTDSQPSRTAATSEMARFEFGTPESVLRYNFGGPPSPM